MSERATALRAVLNLASAQHGAVSAGQVRRCGLSARGQRAAIATGHLSVVEPTVLVSRGSADTWHRRLQVGLLALGPNACVSHEAAAQLHGLDRTETDAVEFTTLRCGRGRSLHRAVVHTTRAFGPTDVITVNGFRCASATRTILDLAASGSTSDRVAAAIDSSVRLRLSASLVIERRLAEVRHRGQSGVRLLDGLLVDSGGESVLERRFLALVRESGIPRPITQRRIRADGRHVARVDFLYEAERMVIEVSGRLGHSSPADRATDAQRRNELTDLGFAVYEYTWSDVTRRKSYVVTTLRARLLRRRGVA